MTQITTPHHVTFFIFLVGISSAAKCPPGLEKCSCAPSGSTGYDVTCTNLTELPPLPKNVTKLTIKKSNFVELHNTSLEGLVDLSEVIIDSCLQLSIIEPGIFTNLTNLTRIHILNAPKLSVLDDGTLSGATGLQLLELTNTSLSDVQGELFQDTQDLETLTIIGESVKGVSSDSFAHLGGLNLLTLSGGKSISIQKDFFKSLPYLKDLVLTENQLKTIESGTFNGLVNLKTLNLNDNELSKINDDTFKGLNVTLLDLSQNQLENVPSVALKDMHGIETLSLAGNKLNSIQDKAFNGLTSLKNLYLDNMPTLATLDPNGFSSLYKLETLSIIDNSGLKDIPATALNKSDLVQLKSMLLHSNGFETLDGSIFSTKPHLNLARIEDNSYNCDCGVLGLRQLMDNVGKYKFAESWQTLPLGPVCSSPAWFKNRLLYRLSTQYELACGAPETIYRSPARVNGTEGGDIRLFVSIVIHIILHSTHLGDPGM